MRSHLPAISTLVLLAAVAVAAPTPAIAAAASPSPRLSALTLSPTKTIGTAVGGRVLGPFSLRNDTRVAYDVSVDAVLLGERRSGAILVRDDAASRRTASRLLGLQVRRFSLPAGQIRSVSGVVKHVAAGEGVYAGILFSARPRTRAAAGAQITNVLRINASQLLAPRHPRPAFAPGRIRAEQAGPQKLRVQIPVDNRGNVLGRVTGHVDVRDAGGRRVLRVPVTRTAILPGVTVDVPAPLRGSLGPGRYTLRAELLTNGRRWHASGSMDLFGTNTVRTEDARLTGLDSPKAVKGEPVEIRAAFLNLGNVPYAPQARVEVRPIDPRAGLGALTASHVLTVGSVRPGREGRITGSISLPEGRAFQLNLRLMAGDRELDAQAVRVDVHEPSTLATRLEEFLRNNAVIIIAAAFALLLAGAAVTIRYVARLKASVRRA